MTSLLWFLIAVSLSVPSLRENQESVARVPPSQDSRVYREPFTLRVRLDKTHNYEERFDKLPYVSDNEIYLFSGEKFGVNLVQRDGETVEVTYQPELKKADVVLHFEQPKGLGVGMMLTIQNKTKRKLQTDALIKVPDREGIFKTSTLSVEAGLSNFESWPHPIIQLVLRNFRLTDSELGKSKR